MRHQESPWALPLMGARMQFKNTCPQCGRQLYIGQMTVHCAIPLQEDGWCDSDSKVWDTQDEIVFCRECDFEGPLEMTDEETVEKDPEVVGEAGGAGEAGPTGDG